MKRKKMIAAATATVLLASGCDTYFDYNSVRVIETQEDNWFWEDGDELVLATIDFRVKPGVPGSAEAFYSSGDFRTFANGLRVGDVEPISNAGGLYVFEDLTVSSFGSLLAGQAPDLVGQVVIAIERDGTPGWIIRERLRDAAADLEQILVEVIESRPISELIADPDALINDLAGATEVLSTETTWFEDLLLSIISLGNADEILNYNVLIFMPVTPELAPLVDNAFAGLPEGFYGGAFPTQAFGGTIPAKRFDLRFAGSGAEYIVETYVGGGNTGGPQGWVP